MNVSKETERKEKKILVEGQENLKAKMSTYCKILMSVLENNSPKTNKNRHIKVRFQFE